MSTTNIAAANAPVGAPDARPTDLPSAMPVHASQMYSRNIFSHAVLQGSSIWNSAWREERARTYAIPPEQLEEHCTRRRAPRPGRW
jgi:hypothetical protein